MHNTTSKKTVLDIVHNEKVVYQRYRQPIYSCGNNPTAASSATISSPIKLLPDKPKIAPNFNRIQETPYECPAGLRLGERIYAFSSWLQVWLKAIVTGINGTGSFPIEYKSKEHAKNPRESYRTNRVRLNTDEEIEESREKYFSLFPQCKDLDKEPV
jgi:hypothetical protein